MLHQLSTDGNAYYARPGPRLLQGTGIIARLIHGEAIVDNNSNSSENSSSGKLNDRIAPKHWLHIQPPTEAELAAALTAEQQTNAATAAATATTATAPTDSNDSTAAPAVAVAAAQA